MRTFAAKINIFILFLLLSCSEEKFEGVDFGTVEGRVVNADTFDPIANAKVFSNPNSGIVFTDEEGYFTLENVATGDYSFQAQKENYVTEFAAVTVNVNNTTEVVFEMELTTATNRSPNMPTLILPEDNAVDTALEVNLTWSASDPENDTLVYKVILRNDINDDIVIYDDINSPNYTLTGLNFGTKYFWQVEASDGINPPVLSEVRAFTTIAFPATRFLFVKRLMENNVIYAGDISGFQLQLTSSENNSWRPRRNIESNKIAFIRSSGAQNHIYTMDPDGSNVFKVTNSVPIAGFNNEYLSFSWNTAGDKLIYPNFDKLYQINADGSGLVQIYQTPNGKLISECDWSFDEAAIALKVNDIDGYGAQIFVISPTGTLITTVISGFSGAIGGLNFSVTGQNLIFTRDVSGFESATYRQLDTRIFRYTFSNNQILEIPTEKPPGTVDIDVRYSPNEAELLFVNTSNDFLSVRNIQKYTIGVLTSRTTLFTNATMPDWE